MRAAVFSDVHGNLLALEAVLADAQSEGVDEYWIVGDLVAHGPHPAQTAIRLMGVANARFVRGNTDRYVLTGDVSGMIPAIDNPATLAESQTLAAAQNSFAWTRGALTAVGAYDWLASLPVEQRFGLPDATRVLLVHAAPGRDDGPGIHDGLSDKAFATTVADADADLIFVGHTHKPLDKSGGGCRVVNLGSVSLPATSDPRAMWTLVTVKDDILEVQRRFSNYDVGIVLAALDSEHHPSAEWLKAKLTRPLIQTDHSCRLSN